MRSLFALAALALSFMFASPAQAAQPAASDVALAADATIKLARGVVATSAQLGSYALCFLALGDEDTCIKVADRALTAVTATR